MSRRSRSWYWGDYRERPADSTIISVPNSRGSTTISTYDGDQWSVFWKQGFITTFGPGKPNNYDGVVFDFWQDKFRELPAGARILDIATGNGAIATFAAEFGIQHAKAFLVAATDLAIISANVVGDSEANAARQTVDFRSHTPCEMQPFDDDSFDLVTSQFGFEYSDIPVTLREVRRILKSDGKFIAISHHAESELIKASRVELEIYALALDELDVFARLRKYHEALGVIEGSREEVSTKLASASSEAATTLDALKDLQRRYPENDCAAQLGSTISILARPHYPGVEQRVAAIEIAQSDFNAARARLLDMVDAALSVEDSESLSVTAREAGFSSTHCLRLFDNDGSLAGWQVHIR